MTAVVWTFALLGAPPVHRARPPVGHLDWDSVTDGSAPSGPVVKYMPQECVCPPR